MLFTGTEVEDTIYPSEDSNDNGVDITTELYTFNPKEVIGSNPSIDHTGQEQSIYVPQSPGAQMIKA